jgi:hypothetical protein
MTGLQINRKTAQYAIEPVHRASLLTFLCSITLETIRTFNIVRLYWSRSEDTPRSIVHWSSAREYVPIMPLETL